MKAGQNHVQAVLTFIWGSSETWNSPRKLWTVVGRSRDRNINSAWHVKKKEKKICISTFIFHTKSEEFIRQHESHMSQEVSSVGLCYTEQEYIEWQTQCKQRRPLELRVSSHSGKYPVAIHGIWSFLRKLHVNQARRMHFMGNYLQELFVFTQMLIWGDELKPEARAKRKILWLLQKFFSECIQVPNCGLVEIHRGREAEQLEQNCGNVFFFFQLQASHYELAVSFSVHVNIVRSNVLLLSVKPY